NSTTDARGWTRILQEETEQTERQKDGGRKIYAACDGSKAMKLLSLIFGLLLPSLAMAGEGLAVLPSKITLSGPAARQQLLLEKTRDGQFVGQVTNGVELVSSDPEIVRIENGVVVPVKNGTASISAKASKQTASARVTVEA